MRFTLYTEKTIPQCVQALNERLQASKYQGRVDKSSGQFSLSVATKVLKRFERSTRLHAALSREEGLTVINGSVPDGATPREWLLVIGGGALLALIFFVSSNAILAILSILVALWSYIPLTGDSENSDTLLREIKRTLQAKETKPKPDTAPPRSAAARPAARPSPLGAARPPSAARPAAPSAKPTSGSKPTAKPPPKSGSKR